MSTCVRDEFTDTLAKVKDVPGRRFDGERKLWLLPPEPAIAERVLFGMQPIADPDIVEWVKSARQTNEQELVSPLPEDSDDLLISWAKARAPWQPEEINEQRVKGLMAHQRAVIASMPLRCILADDQGLGKCVQALSFISECLVRYKDDDEFNGIHAGLQTKTQNEDSKTEFKELSSSARKNTSVNRQEEETAMHGLRHIFAAALYGSRPRTGSSSLFYSAMAVNPSYAWEVARTDGAGGDGKVRRTLPELPSAEALANAPKLIVCPNSVKGTWRREIKRWLGEDSVIPSGSSSSARKRQIEKGAQEGAWIIVNYEQLRVTKIKRKTRTGGTKTETVMKEPLFASTKWLAVIADECHRAKNRKASQTQGLFRVQAPIMLGMSGTPLMNTPDELWALLHWLFPKEYTSYWRFYEQYVDYIEGYFGKVITGVKNPDALRFELNKRLYRRTKNQVLDLPEKTRVRIPIELDAKARKMYSEAEKGLWLEIEKAVTEGDASATRFATEAASGKNIYTIPNGAARTVRLRQILSTPALLGGDDYSNKMDALVENVIDNQHKQHVIFSEFVQSCIILAERLRAKGLIAETYTGQTEEHVRTELEDKFQRGEIDVLVGTIGAMREGITLTAADTQHWLERAWVPGWNEQGEDRNHRIGQKNAVTIYIYEAENTVDDGKIAPTNRLKERIVKTVLPKDEIKEA